MSEGRSIIYTRRVPKDGYPEEEWVSFDGEGPVGVAPSSAPETAALRVFGILLGTSRAEVLQKSDMRG